PRGATEWYVAHLAAMLRSRFLTGHLLYRGNPVTDSDGNYVMITDEPILSEEEWAQLQSAMAALARPRKGQRETTHFLLRVASVASVTRPSTTSAKNAGT